MKKIAFDKLKDKYYKRDVEIVTHNGHNIKGFFQSEVYNIGIIYIGDQPVYIKDIKSIELLKDNTIYKYVVVEYEDDDYGREYSYKTTLNNIKIGDIVLVDRQGQEVTAEVIDINLYTRDTAPYPVDKTKDIISVISHYESEDEEEHSFPNYVSSDDYEYTFNDIEQKVFDKLKEFKMNDKKCLRIILMLRTHYNSDKQCDKMLNFLNYCSLDYDTTLNEIEKYARTLADDDNWFKHCLDCPAIDCGSMSIIDCLENSDEDIWKEHENDEPHEPRPYEVDFEFNDVCKKCKWHNPVIEDKSYLCKDPIRFTGLSEGILNGLDYNNIIAISIAESGAMGCPGNIEIVTYKNNQFLGFDTNPMFGGLPYYKLFKIIPWLEKFRCSLEGVENVGPGWKHIDTGYGNHLLIKDVLYDDINNLSKGKTKGEIYNSWKQWIVEIVPKKELKDFIYSLKPKTENDSVYDYISKNIVMDWLPDDFSLTPFKHKKTGEFVLADGIIENSLDAEFDNDILEQLEGMTSLLQEDTISSNCRIVDEYYENNPNNYVYATIDTFLDWIRKNTDINVDGKLLFKWGEFMMLHGKEIETVKIGLSIISLFKLSEDDEIVEPIKKLALSDELTLYCDVPLSHLNNINELRFELAKKLKGYGKVCIVPKIEVTSPKIEEWLFLHGCENEAGNDWLALEIANKINLPKIIKKADLTQGTLNALYNILEGFNETTNIDYEQYKDADKFIESIISKKNIISQEHHPNLIVEYISILCMLMDFVQINDIKKEYIEQIKQVINTDNVKKILLSELENGDNPKSIIYISSYIDNIDIYDLVYTKFVDAINKGNIDEAFNFVAFLMSNEKSNGEKINALIEKVKPYLSLDRNLGDPEPIINFDDKYKVSIIEGLMYHPMVGTDIIISGLKSKYMYPRRAALQTIELWIGSQEKPTLEFLSKDLLAALYELKEKEIIRQYKLQINNILGIKEDLYKYKDPKVTYYSKNIKNKNLNLINLFDGNIDKLFSYTIISRGHKYFLDKKVYNVVKNNNLYIGYVQGSNQLDEYKVTIKTDEDNNILSMNCSCPYDSNCKHEYATLLYIRNYN